MAASGRNSAYPLVLEAWNKHCVTTSGSCSIADCISMWVVDGFVIGSKNSKINSWNLTWSICALIAIILQLVTTGCGKFHMADWCIVAMIASTVADMFPLCPKQFWYMWKFSLQHRKFRQHCNQLSSYFQLQWSQSPSWTCLQPCIKLYCKSKSKGYSKTVAKSLCDSMYAWIFYWTFIAVNWAVNCLTLLYMGYFDYLVYMGGGGAKKPPVIWLPTVIRLGMNFSNLAK